MIPKNLLLKKLVVLDKNCMTTVLCMNGANNILVIKVSVRGIIKG